MYTRVQKFNFDCERLSWIYPHMENCLYWERESYSPLQYSPPPLFSDDTQSVQICANLFMLHYSATKYLNLCAFADDLICSRMHMQASLIGELNLSRVLD